MPWGSRVAKLSVLIGTSEVTRTRAMTRLGSDLSSAILVTSPTLMPLKCTSPPSDRPRTGPTNSTSYRSYSWLKLSLASQTAKTSRPMNRIKVMAPTRA